MPRSNHTRTLGSENTLAARIARERERRGMTYEALATALTDVGVSVDKSAIYRIEKGKPRRTISVEELVGLARVFETNIEELLRPVELVEQEWAEDIAREFIDATEALDDAHAGLVRAAIRLAKATEAAPEVGQFVINRWQSASPGRQWFGEFVDEPMVSPPDANQWSVDDEGARYIEMPLLSQLTTAGMKFWDLATSIVERAVSEHVNGDD